MQDTNENDMIIVDYQSHGIQISLVNNLAIEYATSSFNNL